MKSKKILRLYPEPQARVGLAGLYLASEYGEPAGLDRQRVYTNYIASLDGRIAVEQPGGGGRNVPEMVTNPDDWRLYQELAAQADMLLVSARYIRELANNKAQAGLPLSNERTFQDLHEWRRANGKPAQPAVTILSRRLDVPLEKVPGLGARDVYVATGSAADRASLIALQRAGVRTIVAGEKEVDGKSLINALSHEGFKRIYSIAGPGVLETLIKGGVLDRVYLTQVHRLIGGTSYDTLLEGSLLLPPVDFRLTALYYDDRSSDNCGQFFGIYDLVTGGDSETCWD